MYLLLHYLYWQHWYLLHSKGVFFLPRSERSLLHNTASSSCTILSQATKIACTVGKRQFNEKHRYVLHIKEKQTCIGKSFTNRCYHRYQCNASFRKLNHRWHLTKIIPIYWQCHRLASASDSPPHPAKHFLHPSPLCV